jgi:hypothetical protein
VRRSCPQVAKVFAAKAPKAAASDGAVTSEDNKKAPSTSANSKAAGKEFFPKAGSGRHCSRYRHAF